MNKFKLFLICAVFLLYAVIYPVPGNAFSSTGCEGDCRKCHSLSNQEATDILKKLKNPNAKILDIQLSPVKSLWEVSVDDTGKRGVFYVDFSKKYVLLGPIVEVSSGSNKTHDRVEKLQESRKIDVSKIPLKNALVLGDSHAAKKVIVFTDPDCPYCAKLHQEMKKVVEKRKDVAFYIKLFPLKSHKDSYWKSKSMICNKSLKMLEDNFENKPIPKTDCGTKEIDNNIKLGESLGITGTPTLILPDGKVQSGAVPADKISGLIDGRR